MTLGERIVGVLGNYPEGLSDGELANRLGANEPSVRRSRNQLVKRGIVIAGGRYYDYPYETRWQMNNFGTHTHHDAMSQDVGFSQL